MFEIPACCISNTLTLVPNLPLLLHLVTSNNEILRGTSHMTILEKTAVEVSILACEAAAAKVYRRDAQVRVVFALGSPELSNDHPLMERLRRSPVFVQQQEHQSQQDHQRWSSGMVRAACRLMVFAG